MKKLTVAVIVAAAVALTGCASAGNQVLEGSNQTSVDQHVIVGQTTTKQVRAYFGDPDAVSYTDSGNEIYNYTFAHATSKAVNFIPVVGLLAGGQNVDKKTLVILFDDKGVVKKSTFSAATSEVKTGLLTQ